jgi:hypothetical protein
MILNSKKNEYYKIPTRTYGPGFINVYRDDQNLKKLFKTNPTNYLNYFDKTNPEKILSLAQYFHVYFGKWIIKRKFDEIDETWEKLKYDCLCGEIGLGGKGEF